MNQKRLLLEQGKTFETNERGNSMSPLIESGQHHVVAPITFDKCKVKDIVFCKVKGHYYTHLVTAVDKIKGVQISNNKGRVNGWTKQVFGKVIEIL